MLLLGHMGIGSKLVSPWTRQLPKWALLLGTILPDLIDKPLYYGLAWITGRHGAELGLISSTRTLGHTAMFLLAITLLAMVRRSRVLAALALGVATHLFLDNLGDTLTDYFAPYPDGTIRTSALTALLWPMYKPYFANMPFKNMAAHLHVTLNPLTIGAEIAGAAILAWDYWKTRHESEILQMLQLRRRHRKEVKRRHKKHLPSTS
jgi:hypothetical protein